MTFAFIHSNESLTGRNWPTRLRSTPVTKVAETRAISLSLRSGSLCGGLPLPFLPIVLDADHAGIEVRHWGFLRIRQQTTIPPHLHVPVFTNETFRSTLRRPKIDMYR